MHSFERHKVQRSQRMENENNPENVPEIDPISF